MQVDQILTRLGDIQQANRFPEAELVAARQCWPEVYPHIRGLMEKFIETEVLSDNEEQLLFFGVFLLADRREHDAFKLLVALCDRSDEIGTPLDRLLSDVVTEDLPTVFYILSGKQLDPLYYLLSSAAAGEFVKSAVIECLFAKLEAQEISPEELSSALLPIVQELDAQAQYFALACLAVECISHALDSFYGVFMKLSQENKLDDDIVDAQSIEQWTLDCPSRLLASLRVERNFDILSLARSGCFNPMPEGHREVFETSLEAEVPEEPRRLYNPVTDKPLVGRNEPCPCGSGKKYKKCCLG